MKTEFYDLYKFDFIEILFVKNLNVESFPSSEATVPKDWGAKSLGGVRTPGTRCVGWA